MRVTSRIAGTILNSLLLILTSFFVVRNWRALHAVAVKERSRTQKDHVKQDLARFEAEKLRWQEWSNNLQLLLQFIMLTSSWNAIFSPVPLLSTILQVVTPSLLLALLQESQRLPPQAQHLKRRN